MKIYASGGGLESSKKYLDRLGGQSSLFRDKKSKELLIRSSSNQSNHLLNSESRPDLNTSTITNSIKTTGKKKNNFKSIEVRNSS